VHELCTNRRFSFDWGAKSRFPKLLKTLETKREDELLEKTPLLCKQGVTGSIPVTSTNFTSLDSLTYAAICNDSLVEIFGALGATSFGMVNP
jgi:hypothetical protein